MIRIKHRRHTHHGGSIEWCDGWLLSCQHNSHASDSVQYVVAYVDPDDRDQAQGMRIAVEKNGYNIRITRTKIPLFEPPAPLGATENIGSMPSARHVPFLGDDDAGK